MTESLFDILSRKDFDEPSEIAAIKQYVRHHFQAEVEVVVQSREIIITSPGASLANTLRFHIPKLQKAAHTDKRIVLRIK